jgi:hypothetical protein
MPLSLVLLTFLVAVDAPCLAGGARHPEPPSLAAQAGLYVAGGLAAFAAHESGHLAANFVLHNRPRIVPVWGFGFVPFFAISPELACDQETCRRADGHIFRAGRRGKFAIVTAGFEVQHVTSEIILTLDQHLRRHRSPFLKGWLTFNIGLSVAYALASVLNIEDSHGDAGGAAALSHMPRALMAAWLVAPAALDAYRYLQNDSPWAPWLSRGLKVGFVSLAWTF